MFDWQEYYLLARKQLSQASSIPQDKTPQKEASLRSAVSRAYYAAYHRACEYLRKMNECPTEQESKRRGSHQAFIDKFINGGSHPGWRKIGKKLWRLKDNRHLADYNPRVTYFVDPNEVADKIALAEEIINLIDSL